MKKLIQGTIFTAATLLSIGVFGAQSAHAATLEVNTQSDALASDGDCTLREALINVNDQADTNTDCTAVGAYGSSDTINFAITGAADFTSSGQNGYTIAPTSGLPNINLPVTINAYSQSGSQPNTAAAPNPLNGILLIELDGSGAGTANGFSLRGNNVVIRGFVINNFTDDAVDVDGDGSVIAGNYMGTEPDGITAAPNDNLAVGNGNGTTDGLRIGGLVPADRNLIAGNGTVPQGGGISPNVGHNNWTIQGNYIGVDKTGMVALGNAQPGGSGSISLDNSDGHIVGGSQPGAINVISGNLGHGIAPHNVDNGQIIGNYIGVGYDGVTPLGNGFAGISASECVNMLIEDNIIANNDNNGIGLYNGDSGVQVYGNTIYNNGQSGIIVFGASDSQIGGGGVGQANVIRDNIGPNIGVLAFNFIGALTDNTRIQGNIIEDSQLEIAGRSAGISVANDATNTLIGGSGAGQGNTIRGNLYAGVAIQELTASALSLTVTPSNVAILGNSISGTLPIGGLFGANSLGIDILSGTDTTGPAPDGIPESYTNLGPTLNDAGDADTGPNNYMNFPVIHDATQNGTNLAINFDLDAADSPVDQYRVEFFANDTADTSGYGEGQTYLGSTTVTNGSGQLASLTLPTNTDLTGKVLSATTTAIDATTPSDFGATSEFSQVRSITVLPQAGLAETGDNTWAYVLGVGVMIVVGVGLRRRLIR